MSKRISNFECFIENFISDKIFFLKQRSSVTSASNAEKIAHKTNRR